MFPKQKLPKSQKTPEWKRSCIHYFAGNRNLTMNRNAEILRLCEIAAGKTIHGSYTAIQNPYNLKGDQFKKYPADLKRFDILSPLFLRTKSDYDKRPFEPVVFTKNSNFNNDRSQAMASMVLESLQTKFVNRLVESGQADQEHASQEQSPDVIENKVSSMKDLETIENQNILDYIIDKENYVKKYSDEFYRFITTNIVVTFKDVRYDEVIKGKVHPANFRWTGNENLEFFEDASVVECEWAMTFEDVVSIFQDAFIAEGYPGALDDLELMWNQQSQASTDTTPGFFATYYRNQYGQDYRATGGITSKRIIVRHIQWTSYRKVYILGYDEQSNPIVVDEDWDGDYQEERWQEEIREGYVIAAKYYIGGDCVEFPVYDANDPFKAKKNYTGKIFMNDIVQQIPLPDKLIQFQEAYDVIKWKLQYTINKNKDKLAVVPIGLLKNTFKQDSYTDDRIGADRIDGGYIDENGDTTNPDTFGQRQDSPADNNPIAEALYFADTTQFLLIDESSKDAALAAQMIKSIDLGLGNYIEFLMSVLASIKQECEDVIGFNRFTTGDYDAKDPVRNVQSGLKQSSAILELYYLEFENYVQNDLQGTIDRAKFAYQQGRSLTFIRNNIGMEVVNVSDKFADSSKGIFIKNSQKTQEILDTLKQESTQMLQNGMKHSTWAKMISASSNYASIIQDIENAENEMMQQQQAASQAQQEHEQQLQQMINDDKAEDRKLEKYKVDVNAQIAIDKNIATLESFQLSNPEGGDNMIELEKIRAQQLARLDETIQRTADRQSNDANERLKSNTKLKEKEIDYKIAKENKNVPAKK